MRLKSFSGKNINGFINYNIKFDKNLTYLIGLNGCGKTTALKLISGLLTPNYIYLVQIPYDKIDLVLQDEKEKIIHISSSKKKEKIQLSIDDEKYTYDLVSENRLYEYLFDPYIDETEIPSQIMKFESGPYVKKIKSIITPIVLGLNRRNRSDNNDYRIRLINHRRFRKDYSQYEGVDLALNDIKETLHNIVRQNSEKRTNITNEFRDSLLVELSNISDIPSFDTILKERHNFKSELKELANRQKKFEFILPNLGVEGLKESFDKFFKKSTVVLEKLIALNNKKEEEMLPLIMEWLSLSYQLKNVDKIIDIGTEYNKKLEKINESFKRLENSLNLFFKETKKSIEISGEGDLLIHIYDGENELLKTNNLFELSSGEKQLIVMFAHLALSEDSEKDVFIIDEPELSLHLTWQEKFVEAMKEAAPNLQLVLATHAPAIINKNENLSYCVNLSRVEVNE